MKDVFLTTKKLSQSTICHSERSEESLIFDTQTLRFAQGDNFEIVTKSTPNALPGISTDECR